MRLVAALFTRPTRPRRSGYCSGAGGVVGDRVDPPFGSNALIERNADGLDTLTVVGVSINAGGTG